MKKLAIILLLASAAATGCKKDQSVRTPAPAACQDTPPANEMCAAAFSRWFYNQRADQCQLVNYSGCSQKGFATKQECENCVKSSR